MSRCKHEHARIKSRTGNFVDAWCDLCEYGWMGFLKPWVSNHASRRLHKPPKWVLSAAQRAEEINS